MRHLLDLYCRALNVLMAIALVCMTVMVFGNVVLRYAFNSGITLSEEISRWLLVWMTFIGALIALKEGGHLGTDVLTSRLPPLGKKLCALIAHLLMLYATWLLFTGSLIQAGIDKTVIAPASGLPMAVMDAAGVFYGASAIVILVTDVWHIIAPPTAGEKS